MPPTDQSVGGGILRILFTKQECHDIIIMEFCSHAEDQNMKKMRKCISAFLLVILFVGVLLTSLYSLTVSAQETALSSGENLSVEEQIC